MQDLLLRRGLFVVARGLLSSCGAWAPECVGSRVHGLCSCGARAPERVDSSLRYTGSVAVARGLVAPCHVGS